LVAPSGPGCATTCPWSSISASSSNVQYYRVEPTCQGGSFSADPGVRLSSFAAGLGALGHYGNVCQTDYRTLLGALVNRIQSAF